uniref:DUF4326 domain-containing protein n=1 Tax=viral metagenome TaxID=1070528 RepID=A0A6C0EB23_9ZZZZ
MNVVNVKKSCLKEQGYDSFKEWQKKKNNLYIGRACVYVGATASKWQNPFPLSKYTLDESLKLYEKHVKESGLIDDINELKGKTLGCWRQMHILLNNNICILPFIFQKIYFWNMM